MRALVLALFTIGCSSSGPDPYQRYAQDSRSDVIEIRSFLHDVYTNPNFDDGSAFCTATMMPLVNLYGMTAVLDASESQRDLLSAMKWTITRPRSGCSEHLDKCVRDCRADYDMIIGRFEQLRVEAREHGIEIESLDERKP